MIQREVWLACPCAIAATSREVCGVAIVTTLLGRRAVCADALAIRLIQYEVTTAGQIALARASVEIFVEWFLAVAVERRVATTLA